MQKWQLSISADQEISRSLFPRIQVENFKGLNEERYFETKFVCMYCIQSMLIYVTATKCPSPILIKYSRQL